MGYCKTSWLKRKADTCERLFKSYKFTKECDHKYTHKWTITVSKSNGDFVNMKYKEQIQTNKYELIRLVKNTATFWISLLFLYWSLCLSTLSNSCITKTTRMDNVRSKQII